MVKRCLEAGRPFGIIRLGDDGLADVGTIAEIREATRYVDGRWDLVVLGGTRFTVASLDDEAPYLRAVVELVEEEVGPDLLRAAELAEQVSDRFVEYLDLLRGDDAGDDGDGDEEEGDDQGEVTPEAIDEALAEEEQELSHEVVSEIERLLVASNAASGPTRITEEGDEPGEDEEMDDDEAGRLLESAIDRLTGTDDPVGLSHVVSGVVQLTVAQRQELLEAPTATDRLALLLHHLERENLLLARGIRPWLADARTLRERRN
ncbi:MAG: hypothetical protein RLZZ432_941 [Chloroflexota bacterium]